MNDQYLAVLQKAIAQFGKTSQMIIAIEELSEVTKEICKVLRGEGNKSHVAEEIADARIMLAQLEILFDCERETREWTEYKLTRLRARIEKHSPIDD